MRELLEMCDPGSAFDTSRLQVSDISGRQYMDEWIASTLKERGDHSKEWFEENCPAKALFYEMYDRAKQFIEK